MSLNPLTTMNPSSSFVKNTSSHALFSFAVKTNAMVPQTLEMHTKTVLSIYWVLSCGPGCRWFRGNWRRACLPGLRNSCIRGNTITILSISMHVTECDSGSLITDSDKENWQCDLPRAGWESTCSGDHHSWWYCHQYCCHYNHCNDYHEYY